MIRDKKHIGEYLEFRTASNRSHFHHADSVKLLSDPLQKVIKKDQYLKPEHLSNDLAMQIFIESCCLHCKDFQVDEHNKDVICNIVYYVTRSPKFSAAGINYSFGKGLMIKGRVGCGKTILMKGLNSFLAIFHFRDDYRNDFSLTFESVNAYSISEYYAKQGIEILENGIGNNRKLYLLSGGLLIDDIGAEPIVSYYGNQSNIIAEILLRRYDRKLLTYATTNLDAAHLKKMYGDRAASRMKSMFNEMYLKGDDRRK